MGDTGTDNVTFTASAPTQVSHPRPHPHSRPSTHSRPSRGSLEDDLSREFSNQDKDWCAIVSTFVVACTLALIGVSLILKGDPTTGLVFIFVGGSLMLLAICGAAGKCKMTNNNDNKRGPRRYFHDMDRPPSYRGSWRRSFLRRHTNMNAVINVDSSVQTDVEESHHHHNNNNNNNNNRNDVTIATAEADHDDNNTTTTTISNAHHNHHTSSTTNYDYNMYLHQQQQHTARGTPVRIPVLLIQTCPHLNPLNGPTPFNTTATATATTRHTRSLCNLQDPPSYETALASMNEAQLRLLKSELNLSTHPG